MKLGGKLIIERTIINEAEVFNEDDKLSFRDKLEDCLIRLCKELDIETPIWLKKNTTELALFRKTSFYKEQFMQEVKFYKLEIFLGKM